MTARYAALPRRPGAIDVGDEWYPDLRETVDVIVDETAPRDTGLVDQFGMRIYRMPHKERCGF